MHRAVAITPSLEYHLISISGRHSLIANVHFFAAVLQNLNKSPNCCSLSKFRLLSYRILLNAKNDFYRAMLC